MSRPTPDSPPTQLPETPTVSVILTIYSDDRLPYLSDAVDSLLEQTYNNLELVIVVDANRSLYTTLTDRYTDSSLITTHFKETDEGLSASRNYGARQAQGDIVAFTDDDVHADEHWVEELVAVYQRHDALAVGGPAHPQWEDGVRPLWLPDEFDWLVGITHSTVPDEEQPIRNTFGCNISFRRDVFLDLGGFDQSLGKQDGVAIQGEEAALCAELAHQYDRPVFYAPDASVEHRVFESQTSLSYLVSRSFWQGYSKRVLDAVTPTTPDKEYDYLSTILFSCLPRRLLTAFTGDGRSLFAAVMIVVYTIATGLGFLYGAVRTPTVSSTE